MTFLLKPAIREKINLLFAIAGPSGSGKTYSALLLAQGIAGDNGKIAVIDTEAGRALQYAPKNNEPANPEKGTFNFLHLDFQPPFEPQRYIEAIETCEKAGATVIVIDSASHEWNGEGGVTESAEHNALAKAADSKGNIDYKKLNSVKLLSWAEPKKQHKRMMARLTQIRSHIIFCLRAEDKVKLVYQNGKATITPVGFQPICEKGFMFEMTASMTMDTTNPGCPNYDLDKKLNNDMKSIFTNGNLVTIKHGQRLKQWAETGDTNIPATEHQSKIVNEQVSSPPPPINRQAIAIQWTEDFIKKVNDIPTEQALQTLTADQKIIDRRERLNKEYPDLAQKINNAVHARLNVFHENHDMTPPAGQFDDGQGVMQHVV